MHRTGTQALRALTPPGPAPVAADPAPAAAAPLRLHRPRGRLHATVSALRPKQWIKNGLVLAAAGAAGAYGQDGVVVRVLAAFVAFCLLASGIYAINDVRDAAEDRLHPRKCRRPVAAGEISARYALSMAALLIAGGLAICTVISPLTLAVGAGYAALTVTYTLVWRHVFLLDIFAVAGGFVLRALAGGVAADVPLSRWFMLVVSAGAVCLAASKRIAELRRVERTGEPRRRVLAHYRVVQLAWILGLAAITAVLAYGIWTVRVPAVEGFPWRPLTAIPFTAALARYTWLVRGGAGEAPEEVVLGDVPLMVFGCVWLILFALGVHAGA